MINPEGLRSLHNIFTMRDIIIKTDEDNDIYEIIIDGISYNYDDYDETPWLQKLWDSLNMSIELLPIV